MGRKDLIFFKSKADLESKILWKLNLDKLIATNSEFFAISELEVS